QQRWWNCKTLLLAIGVNEAKFIIQAIFSADEWRAQCNGHIVTSQRGTHQRTQCFWLLAIAPTETVQNSDTIWIAPDGHAVSHRFVDGACSHVVRIKFPGARIHTAGYYHS